MNKESSFIYKNILIEINGPLSHKHLKVVIYTPDIERYAVDESEAKFIVDDFLENYVPDENEFIF